MTMTVLVFLLAGAPLQYADPAIPQDPVVAATVPEPVPFVPELPSQALYEPPPVRPFEPPSDFGREAQAVPGGNHRGSIVEAVGIDDYRGQFEAGPTGAVIAYAEGVDSAEARMDQRMGPMDGLWRVVDAEGGVRLSLAVSDPGHGVPLEGAWMTPDGRRSGTLTSGRREGLDVTLLLLDGGTLVLSPSGVGYAGTLEVDGRIIAVSLSRRPR